MALNKGLKGTVVNQICIFVLRELTLCHKFELSNPNIRLKVYTMGLQRYM